MARPTVEPAFSTSGANVVEPSSGKKATGWLDSEIPPSEFFNWIHKITFDWIHYFAGIIPDGPLPLKSDTDAAATQTLATFNNAEHGVNPASSETVKLRDTLHADRVRSAFSKGDTSLTVGFASGKLFRQFASNGAGRIVGVGDSGLIGYSDDAGATWTVATPDASFTATFNHIIFANNLFVAVGGDGGGTSSATLQTSSDGITWTQRLSAASNAFWNVAYNGTLFCIQLWDGSAYGVYWSTNGTTGWTSSGVSTAFGTAPRAVIGGGGIFVKGLNSVSNNVYTSTDAITWTARAMGSSDNFTANFISFHANYGYVVAGTDGSNVNKYVQFSSIALGGWTRVRKETAQGKLVTGLVATSRGAFVLTEAQASPCWFVHLGAYSDSAADFICAPHARRWAAVYIGNNVYVALTDGGTGVINRVLWLE
jgi:hypothetical protein